MLYTPADVLLRRMLFSLLVADGNRAWSNCSIISPTTTDVYIQTPPWMYPLSYSPCRTCEAYLITDIHQPITSHTVDQGATTSYIAPFWEWNFHRTRTVTVIEASAIPKSQIQTWFAGLPQITAVLNEMAYGIAYHYCYERIITFVVQDPQDGIETPRTVTITSTVTSVLTNPPPTPQMTSQESTGLSSAQQTSEAGVNFFQDGTFRRQSLPAQMTQLYSFTTVFISSSTTALGSDNATTTSDHPLLVPGTTHPPQITDNTLGSRVSLSVISFTNLTDFQITSIRSEDGSGGVNFSDHVTKTASGSPSTTSLAAGLLGATIPVYHEPVVTGGSGFSSNSPDPGTARSLSTSREREQSSMRESEVFNISPIGVVATMTSIPSSATVVASSLTASTGGIPRTNEASTVNLVMTASLPLSMSSGTGTGAILSDHSFYAILSSSFTPRGSISTSFMIAYISSGTTTPRQFGSEALSKTTLSTGSSQSPMTVQTVASPKVTVDAAGSDSVSPYPVPWSSSGIQISTSQTSRDHASAASASPSASSTSSDRTFQLYVANNISGLDTLAVGESGNGQLVVGGVIAATVLQINNATNMTDLDGNYIYFVPKGTTSRLRKRQDDDPTLQYSPDPPVEAVTSGFSLQDITLSSNTTEGNYTFYTCDRSPNSQPIFVAEIGQSPERCYTFNLVTKPPPLNDTNSTASSSQMSNTVESSTIVAVESSSESLASAESSSLIPAVDTSFGPSTELSTPSATQLTSASSIDPNSIHVTVDNSVSFTQTGSASIGRDSLAPSFTSWVSTPQGYVTMGPSRATTANASSNRAAITISATSSSQGSAYIITVPTSSYPAAGPASSDTTIIDSRSSLTTGSFGEAGAISSSSNARSVGQSSASPQYILSTIHPISASSTTGSSPSGPGITGFISTTDLGSSNLNLSALGISSLGVGATWPATQESVVLGSDTLRVSTEGTAVSSPALPGSSPSQDGTSSMTTSSKVSEIYSESSLITPGSPLNLPAASSSDLMLPSAPSSAQSMIGPIFSNTETSGYDSAKATSGNDQPTIISTESMYLTSMDSGGAAISNYQTGGMYDLTLTSTVIQPTPQSTAIYSPRLDSSGAAASSNPSFSESNATAFPSTFSEPTTSSYSIISPLTSVADASISSNIQPNVTDSARAISKDSQPSSQQADSDFLFSGVSASPTSSLSQSSVLLSDTTHSVSGNPAESSLSSTNGAANSIDSGAGVTISTAAGTSPNSLPAVISSSFEASTSFISTTSSSASSSRSIAASIVQSEGSFVNQGLYYDQSSQRILNDATSSGPSMSVSACASFCHAFTYFGVENGMLQGD